MLFDCGEDKGCRWSDSAFVTLNDGVKADLGRIKRPIGPNEDPTQKRIDQKFVAGDFIVVDRANFPLDGQSVSKVGRTTGWTRGEVTDTCVNSNPNITLPSQPAGGYKLQCQDQASYQSKPGDSGSPVFEILDPVDPLPKDDQLVRVKLVGINWGSIGAKGGTALFSALGNVEFDLGPLNVIAPPATNIKYEGPIGVGPNNPDPIELSAALLGHEGEPIKGRVLEFSIETQAGDVLVSASDTTDLNGRARVMVRTPAHTGQELRAIWRRDERVVAPFRPHPPVATPPERARYQESVPSQETKTTGGIVGATPAAPTSSLTAGGPALLDLLALAPYLRYMTEPPATPSPLSAPACSDGRSDAASRPGRPCESAPTLRLFRRRM